VNSADYRNAYEGWRASLRVPKVETSKSPESKLLQTLKSRFEAYPENHKGVEWPEVEKALAAHPEDMASLEKLEETGGKPQVVGVEGDEIIFEDRSAESPSGRRNKNFNEADEQRKSFGPNVRFQSPESYKAMQKTGKFDLNSWSWLETDAKTRKAGGALNGCRLIGGVNVGEILTDDRHSRKGWRASLRVKKA